VRIWAIHRPILRHDRGVSDDVGPLYVFRNVVHRSRYSPRHGFNTGVFLKAQSRQTVTTLWVAAEFTSSQHIVPHVSRRRTATGNKPIRQQAAELRFAQTFSM